MAANVLYFGPDECKRVRVLESAGYSVREYHKIEELKSALESPSQPAAVVVSDVERPYAHPLVEIIHSRVRSAPVIIFPSRNEPELEESADLVIPPLTPPEEWLREIAELLE